jgi:hypothetical protein
MPVTLTPDEQAELDRQNSLANHSRFHDIIRCGKPLELRFYFKRHTRYHRQFCTVHQVVVNMNGWELGWYGGELLRKE